VEKLAPKRDGEVFKNDRTKELKMTKTPPKAVKTPPMNVITKTPLKAIEVRPKIRFKSYVVVESGFHCRQCGFETVTFDGSVPGRCAQCGTRGPSIAWKNRITSNLKVETLPLS
jgi:hypothetical protein